LKSTTIQSSDVTPRVYRPQPQRHPLFVHFVVVSPEKSTKRFTPALRYALCALFFPAPAAEPMDTVIAHRELTIERKRLTVEIRENLRGRFLRITEEVGGRRNAIIIPDTGLNEFNAAVDAVIVAANSAPPPSAV
jgi:hypothetical protein